MTQRLHYAELAPDLFKKYLDFSLALRQSGLEPALRDLVTLRASQLNGCALCVDMHLKQATLHGERPLRLHHLTIWRESPLFTDRERAALAWAEVLTRLPEHGVPDDLYEQVRAQFSAQELSDLTFVVMSINAWNRANVAFRTVPGAFDAAFGLEKANLQ